MQHQELSIEKSEDDSLCAEVAQYIVYFVLLSLINLDTKQEKRRHIFRLAVTSRAWRDLMLAPLDTKLFANNLTHLSKTGKSTIEILRHRLFASAGVVILKNGDTVTREYVPNISNLIKLPSPVITSTNSNHAQSNDCQNLSSTSQPLAIKRCYAVGIEIRSGLKKSFESGESVADEFKAFENRHDAETYARSIPQNIFGYTVAPRVVQPIHIRPRKLSSGGINQSLELQFFNVHLEEMSPDTATPPPDLDQSFKFHND